MGQGCSRCCKKCRGKRRREKPPQQTRGVSTVVSAAEEPSKSGGHRSGNVRVLVVQDDRRDGGRTPEYASTPPAGMGNAHSPSAPGADGEEDLVTARSGVFRSRADLQRRNSQAMLSFEVCSVDRDTFSELSYASSSESVDDMPVQRTTSGIVPSASGTAPEGPTDSPPKNRDGAHTPQAQGAKAPAKQLDARQLDYVMSRIFASTYHTPSMCLLNLSARTELAVLSSKELSNSVMVTTQFSQTVFGKSKATGNEVLGWLLKGKDRCPPGHGGPRPVPFQQLAPTLSDDDMVFFADQRRILRRLLMKPRPKGTAHDADDVDSEFDDSDSEYDPEEHLSERTLEEGFCQVLLPNSGADGTTPVVATLYVSTIAAQTLPQDISTTFKRDVTPLLGVVSVVGTRPIDHPSITLIPNTLAEFPKSSARLHDRASGSVLEANEAPCFIRSEHFTGNVFIKTVTEPTPDPRIQPYFEGKNRKFEIQIQGRFTPPQGFDLSAGTICFGCFIDDKLGGPGGKPLTWMQGTMVKGIIGAFKMIARGGLAVQTGNEKEDAHPMMAIPLLSFIDRLSLRGNAEGAIPPPPEENPNQKPHKSPALALGVTMLPETPELATLKKTAEVEAKEAQKRYKKEKKENPHAEPPPEHKQYFKERETSYTMSFHSQYVDFEAWMMRKVPGFSNVDLHTYWGNQHPYVAVVWVPHGTPLTELRSKGTFLLKLSVEHVTNVEAQAAQAAEAAEGAAGAERHVDPMA
uniref:Domain of unknown function at the cortex 1 domain-containing protein n=1 Tax=Neobodo designis TaxID=312471 RepID=A0A7S1Q3Y5_NEODS|mmetsp:Transcript_30608/g.94557  ORF Transcript_30608/g.94557 Transcript_30608/m.94557 type:complete len:746 (+) Transcript_30608:219-2456(+)|eukprot:CAMPEP_0174849142 /NCGR_PEP_ID=MMETSP1114-20130205/13919_1 /TAXON_ID=312471 /ORGANISM="Neobodo designis, Strain CCAP 1951/1" /LENGTH=745 /DNA_ID=CAMNT_0016083453 /DNA_START=218 /DNA_END=2455 /DNA_ORIENTATION=+